MIEFLEIPREKPHKINKIHFDKRKKLKIKKIEKILFSIAIGIFAISIISDFESIALMIISMIGFGFTIIFWYIILYGIIIIFQVIVAFFVGVIGIIRNINRLKLTYILKLIFLCFLTDECQQHFEDMIQDILGDNKKYIAYYKIIKLYFWEMLLMRIINESYLRFKNVIFRSFIK